jgi:hypothetical protein
LSEAILHARNLNQKSSGDGRRVKVEAEGIPRNDLDATTGDIPWNLDSRAHDGFPGIQWQIVGYGFTGTGLTGWKTLDGQKRAFQNVIDGDMGNPASVLLADFDNPHSAANNNFGDATPLPLEGCGAPGDSGGGVFVMVGAQYYLAGVTSFVASTNGNANSSYGNVSGFDPISAAMPWINATVPEPSIFALIATSGSGFLAGKNFGNQRKIKMVSAF